MSHREMQEKVQLEKSVRRLRETLLGGVLLERAVLLMRKYFNNYSLVVRHIVLMVNDSSDELDDEDRRDIENDPVVQNVINTLRAEEDRKKNAQEEPSEDSDIKKLGQRLTKANLVLFNRTNDALMPWRDCQFSCQRCDRFWWRRVPERKQVSRCRKCKKKYDPVPADKLWGYAEFHCQQCGNVFGGFGQMHLPAPCYSCNAAVTPTRILPPRKSQGPRSRRPHSCCAEDCYNRKEPHVLGTFCVHPRSRQRRGLARVVYASPEHHSTGSTVATCLSQGSLMECDVEDIIEEDIIEEEENQSESSEDEESGD
uniref:Uncharacterized protein n=1 Tax=Callorhinchus milii TaxID=7868 RepID=V9L5D0_CALMI|eukprot:gi/632977424/ref/XP_007905335.1/ PREDICTED: UPF0515 protein C19orf66 homolog [Callorhinchus milii]